MAPLKRVRQLTALQENLKVLYSSQDAEALARKEIEIHRLNEALDRLQAQLAAAAKRGSEAGSVCQGPCGSPLCETRH